MNVQHDLATIDLSKTKLELEKLHLQYKFMSSKSDDAQ